MANTLLILGNGFDLAMNRMTSYTHFLDFYRMIKGQKNFFSELQKLINQEEKELKNFEKQIQKIEDEEDKKDSLTSEIFIDDKKIDLWYSSKEDRNTHEISRDKEMLNILTNLWWPSLFEKKLSDKSSLRKHHSPLAVYDGLSRNAIWYYTERLHRIDSNWSSLEKNIENLLEALLVLKKNPDYFRLDPLEVKIPNQREESETIKFLINMMSKLGTNTNYKLGDELEIINESSGGFDLYQRFNNSIESGQLTRISIKILFQQLYNDLMQMTELLDLYLSIQDVLDFSKDTYGSNVPTNIEGFRKQVDVLRAIEEKEIKFPINPNLFVINFNYTNTAEQIFFKGQHKNQQRRIHHIHGRVSLEYTKLTKGLGSKIDPSGTKLVFGIEDKNDFLNQTIKHEKVIEEIDLVDFQKYFQRILYGTGYKYRGFFDQMNKGFDNLNIIIFGHSVDPNDKEIFIDIRKRAEEYCKSQNEERKKVGQGVHKKTVDDINFRLIFTYYVEEDKRTILKNLVTIFGKDGLMELSQTGRLHFIPSNSKSSFQKMYDTLLY